MPKYSDITIEHVRTLIDQYDVGEVVEFDVRL